MNFRVYFSLSLVVCVLTISSAVGASVPTQPGALRVDVYSNTAAEIFWDRSTDDGRIKGYEISFNDSIVETLDATSYFTSSLEIDRRYSVTVTAIDDEGNTSTPASLTFTGGNRSEADSDTPASPAELRAEVYSSTAIELFWNRSNSSGLFYEISIDDILVSSNQGTSFFTDSLVAGQRYAFSVVAVDSSGNRSGPATVVAETASGNDSAEPARPEMPDNVSIMRYSSTAAELFWDRPPVEDNIASTEIARDSITIGNSEGTSFFDDTRDPDVRYTYQLTFIDAQGRRSVTTELIESQPMPIINRDNHIDIVAEALPVYSGDRYNTLLVDSLEVVLEQFLGEVNLEFPVTHVCTNGGTAYFDSSPFFIVFDNCQISEAIYTGNYGIQVGNSDSVSSDGLTITSLSGLAIQFSGSLQFTSNTDFYRTFSVDVELKSPSSTFSLENAETQFNFAHLGRGGGGPNFRAVFKGAFDFRAPGTGSRLISADTLSDFGYSEPFETHAEDWNYRTGMLQLIATDGSELILDADTGDDSTVSVQLNNNQGSEEFLQPWSLWQSVLRRSPLCQASCPEFVPFD